METKGFDFAAIPGTAVRVLTNPAGFFREMPKTGGFVEPLIFMVAMGVVGGLIQSILAVIGFRMAAGMAMGVASIIILPIMIAIFGFVGAAILFVIWKLMGSQESYETAYRCGAYASALTPVTTLIGVIPYVGSAIGVALMVYYLIVASVEVHSIPAGKARLVFGIIGAILIVFSISGEFTARRMARQMEEASKEMQKQAEEIEKRADEARKAAEQMQKQLEQQSEEAKKASEEIQKQMEEMQKQMKR